MKGRFTVRRVLNTHVFYLFSFIVLFSLIIGSVNRAFFSLANFCDILNSSVTLGIMAVGVLLVMISGGIDVSSTAIAAVSMYCSVSLLNTFGGNVIFAFIVSAGIGAFLGLINAATVACFNVSTLIITLATSNIFFGLLLEIVPQAHITTIPSSLVNLGNSSVLAGASGVRLSVPAFLMLLIMFLLSCFLKFSGLGRNIYVVGGNKEAAKRAGISCWKTQFVVFSMAGALAGLAAILDVSMIRYVNPFNIYNMTMDLIAAAVLGGASLSGGSGTVLGTFLGVITLFIVKNSLVLLGVPSTWYSVIIGSLIIISVAITVARQRITLTWRNG